MNIKNVVLSIFILLTVLFASIDLIEQGQTGRVTVTTTVFTTSLSTYTSCTYTGGIGCPHSFNQTYTVSVDYSGPWGATYEGYLEVGQSGTPAESGSFYGLAPKNESVVFAGTLTFGTTFCVTAQKLDASNAMLIVRILPSEATNQTSVAYGTASACIETAIV